MGSSSDHVSFSRKDVMEIFEEYGKYHQYEFQHTSSLTISRIDPGYAFCRGQLGARLWICKSRCEIHDFCCSKIGKNIPSLTEEEYQEAVLRFPEYGI